LIFGPDQEHQIVWEKVQADLYRKCEPGMTFSTRIGKIIEHEKKRCLLEDIMRIQGGEEDLKYYTRFMPMK